MNSIRCDFSPYNIRVWTEIKMLKKAVKMTSDAVKMLKDVENANSYLNKIINMLEFFICSLKTAVNVSKLYVLKNKLKLAKTKSKSYSIISKIKKLCHQEIENAQNCIKFVELDSRLGYNLDMDYVCDKEHLEWKIRQVKNMMEVDLGVYINCLKGS
ncbi:MAG: hypothetical protein IJX16_06565 [Clostridia bacterium]|nr:hypothetical protein [Clostridia bacterium]